MLQSGYTAKSVGNTKKKRKKEFKNNQNKKQSKKWRKDMLMIGIREGQTKRYKAGATRREAFLQVNESILINDRKIKKNKNLLIYWHRGSADTFHGIHDPFAVKLRGECNCNPRNEYGWCRFQQSLKYAETQSTSGGGEAYGYVVKIEKPIGIITSNYKRRGGWEILVILPGENGPYIEYKGSLKEWIAMNKEPEEL